jgi:hypothetical protein
MMAVLIIMGLVLGIVSGVIPMFQSSAVDGGATQLASQLRLARQYAISKRAYVAVVMPKQDMATTPVIDGQHQYRAASFRPCIVDSSHAFQSWVPRSSWTYMPGGAYIKDSFTADTVTSAEFVNPGGTAATADLRAVVFKPNGSLHGGDSQTVTVYRATLLDTTLKEAVNGADQKTFTVNWLTGRLSWD